MKIGYYMHGIGWGGAAGSLMLLLKKLYNDGNKKYLYTTIDRSNKARDEFIRLTDVYKEIPFPHLYNDQAGGYTHPRDFKKIISTFPELLIEEINSHNIDIIHLNSTVLSHTLEPIKKYTNAKVVIHVREMLPPYDGGIVRNFMIERIEKYADAIICISDNEASQFTRSNNIFTIANPFDFDSIKNLKENYIDKLGLQNYINVAMSGQFSKSRGHLIFLKAINYLVNQKKIDIKNARFLIFGPTKKTSLPKYIAKRLIGREDTNWTYYSFLKKSGLEKIVLSFPSLYLDDFHSFLKNIDIYVRPSLAADPWGRDVIEAMAFSKPIVATGYSEYFVKNGVNGYLTKPGNYKELAKKILYLIKNEEDRRVMGKRSYGIIREKCDLEKYARKINGIYQNQVYNLE